jgi:hypothetical protein
MLAVRLSSVMSVYNCVRALSWFFHHYLPHLLDSTFTFYIKTVDDLCNTLAGSYVSELWSPYICKTLLPSVSLPADALTHFGASNSTPLLKSGLTLYFIVTIFLLCSNSDPLTQFSSRQYLPVSSKALNTANVRNIIKINHKPLGKDGLTVLSK